MARPGYRRVAVQQLNGLGFNAKEVAAEVQRERERREREKERRELNEMKR